MTDAFDVGAELAAAIGDRAGVWRFIRDFAASWRSPLANDDGWSDADLDAAERRLGLRLPAALREAYRLFGRRDDLTNLQDTLLAPARLHLDERGETLVFRVENQGVALWGVPVARLGEPDPPVMVWMDPPGRWAEAWAGWLDRFSLSCVEIVLSESLFSDEHLGDNRALEAGEAELLALRYQRLPLPAYPVLGSDVAGTRWFGGPDLILRDDQGDWLWVRARTPEALLAVREELLGDWLMAESD